MADLLSSLLKEIYQLPLIGNFIYKLIVDYPIGGWVFLFIVSILGINKWTISHTGINVLQNVPLIIKKNREYQNDRRRNVFYKDSSTKDYINWLNGVLKTLYDEYKLLRLFGKEYPVVTHDSVKRIRYPFKKNLTDTTKVVNTNIPDFNPDKGQKQYIKVMGNTIKWPEVIGFALDKFHLNDEGKMTGFTAKTCQYKHNVATSHILEYEMYKLYLKNKKKMGMQEAGELLESLPYRCKIHEANEQTNIMTTGCNRYSLMSVQMLVVYYDDFIKDYKALTFHRSDKVAIKPNYWQFIPAGGFEIFEKSSTTNPYIIEQNFDVELALFRELIEEAFDGRDFEYNRSGEEVNNLVRNHKDIVQIKKWIKSNKAHLEFMGIVTDMVSLRPELSFLLVIDTPEFQEIKLKINDEGQDYQAVKVNDLPAMLSGELLYPSSAGLLKLAMQSQLFKERELLQHS
ncbi:hypothetical protein [Halobacillus faecis]|uniref:Uncharacterized protein n=1 Tax=Halobacillus faecis TaxID=360184 RepID=A0A511WTN5_9BACI|nr:hypothetical protein [Halobacillus faecis]GEN54534.1 hypothetical protein HFA01_27960 [Halobacillus faecis]